MKPMILSKRFEVTIPKQVRESLKLRVGQQFQIKNADSHIILVPQSKAPSGATSKTNEQRRSKNCGWRNMPPRRDQLGVWRAGFCEMTRRNGKEVI